MNKKVSIATLSAFLVATSPAMAVNEANTLYVNLELSLNRTTVGMIIQSISEQTGYEFSYDESILDTSGIIQAVEKAGYGAIPKTLAQSVRPCKK